MCILFFYLPKIKQFLKITSEVQISSVMKIKVSNSLYKKNNVNHMYNIS